MPVNLTLTQKVSDALWRASGTFSNEEEGNSVSHQATDILVKQNDNELELFADVNEYNGKIGNHSVIHFAPHEPFIIDDVGVGTKLNFKEIFVTVKLK
jgi:hypothetical protein